MPSPPPPLRFQPLFERPEEDEAETNKALQETLRKILDTTYEDYGHAVRSVHAKSHALLQAELEVLDGLPEPLAQGLYARPGRYRAVLRLSTNPGDILDDSVSTPRGLAIKVAGVEGERMPGSEGHNTQDYVLVNGPAFIKPDAKSFLKSLKLLGATTDKLPGGKKVLSAVLRGAEKLVEKAGGQSPTLISMGGHPQTHPLGETFYSQTPFLHGPYIAKVAVVPVSPELAALTRAPLDVTGKPNGLREAMQDFFAGQAGVWDVRVQLCNDLEAMPIEDASVVWPEDRSPYVTVARLTAARQPAWSEARAGVVDDTLSFSPWHGLAAHRPLGSVNRMRKAAYEMSARFRSERNARPVEEPATLDPLPG